jgi:predicted short-subunit dehydrogenase-like oxidoreductase (DUF2520 family)
MRRSVSIIGLGNWGSSLAHALDTAGVSLQEVILTGERSRRSASNRTLARALPLTTLDLAQLKADILWLCVPDGAIKQITGRIVKRVGKHGLKGQIVVHSSGALSALVLQAAARVGASVASVHPVMSFATRAPVSLEGVPFGVDAEPPARRILNAILRQVGGRPFAVEAANKALYHAVGVLSSPLLVSHLAAAHEAATLAGFTHQQAKRLIMPIVRATVDNFFLRGPAKSFSGPIARGDLQTIHLHLQALKPHPILAGVYRSLALYALETLPAAGKNKLRSSLRRK